jgi:anti-sigma factor (TIGR02949 family)
MSEHLDRMTCEEAFRRLDDFLDHELNPEEMRLVQEHLDVCAQCTREFNFERSVLTGVRSKLSRIAAPPNLLSRIAPFLGRPDPKDAPDAGGSA